MKIFASSHRLCTSPLCRRMPLRMSFREGWNLFWFQWRHWTFAIVYDWKPCSLPSGAGFGK
jgi:hypothetical protein